MGDFLASSATTTNLSNTVPNFSVASQTPDNVYNKAQTFWDFPDASKQMGYYKKIPELKKAIDALAIWTVGKGFTANALDKVTVDYFVGYGEDTFVSILWNMIVQKKIFGDAFAEIVKVKGQLVNLKPLYAGNMRIYFTENGVIERYEHRQANGDFKTYQPDEIFHLANDRIANEMHGISVIDACKDVIDFRNELLTDYRKLTHRDLALGVMYVDADKESEMTAVKNKYADAIKNGEVLVLPKGTAELADAPQRSHQDRLALIQYLEGFFYQAVGVPRVIASSQDYSEASSKVGYLTFEPIYTFEQTLLEADLWNQLGLRITFNRPPSLSSTMGESEQKNTGQTGFQQSDVQASVGRTE